MRRMYQCEWHGIEFSSLAGCSSRRLADAAFYVAFYEKFFARYRNWEDLSPTWRRGKELCAERVLSVAGPRSTVLSIGCGLGYMEYFLRARSADTDIYLHEVAPSAWNWIRGEFAVDHLLLGEIPACLPAEARFDVAYLCAVEYALDDEALVHLLASLRSVLRPRGRLLMISASFQPTASTAVEHVRAVARGVKDVVAAALDAAGLRSRGQFWGWMRTREQLRALMRSAGYRDVEDGFVEPSRRDYYWIAGS